MRDENPALRWNTTNRRRPTPGEKKLINKVFGKGAINTNAFVLEEKGKFLGGAAVTWGQYIVYPRGRMPADFSRASLQDQAWFLHEMAHVHQHQKGKMLIPEKGESWLKSLVKRKPEYNYSPDYGRKPFRKWNIEQQAAFLEDFYLLSKGGRRRYNTSLGLADYVRVLMDNGINPTQHIEQNNPELFPSFKPLPKERRGQYERTDKNSRQLAQKNPEQAPNDNPRRFVLRGPLSVPEQNDRASSIKPAFQKPEHVMEKARVSPVTFVSKESGQEDRSIKQAVFAIDEAKPPLFPKATEHDLFENHREFETLPMSNRKFEDYTLPGGGRRAVLPDDQLAAASEVSSRVPDFDEPRWNHMKRGWDFLRSGAQRPRRSFRASPRKGAGKVTPFGIARFS